MSIDLKVYDNGDHTCLVWLPADGKPIPDCRGFTIRRVCNGTATYLHGFVGFSDADVLDPANPWKFPLQRYMWWDYGVSPGDVVQYSVIPVVGPDKDHLRLASADATALTEPMTVTGQVSPSVSAYFNRGIVAAQWVARSLADAGKGKTLAEQIGTPGNKLRNELSGLLRPQILEMLEQAKKNKVDVYAALYELNDPELIEALKALGSKCHLLLANGAFKPPDNDENKKIRQQLRGKVDLHNRLVSSGHFAHNKFLVVCDANGKPQRVLSGSTNWTQTGLCTQANNGVIVEDSKLAQDFLDEWNLLKNAGNQYPPALAKANSQQKSFQVDGCQITQWFAPTNGGPDLDYARKLINAAEEGILFLFFNPGAFVSADTPEKWTLLQNILVRHQSGDPNFRPELYIRGVVNQEIAGLTTPDKPAKGSASHAVLDPSAVANPVTLFSGGNRPPRRLNFEVMVPENIKSTFHNWTEEVLGKGVHVHSKVIVLDPFGKKPVVMTGSHNLGYKASTKNDDNLMIIEGNSALAAAYAVNIVAIYQSYRWNASVEAHRQDPHLWHGLVDNDQWQNDYLTGDHLDELHFWTGEATPADADAPVKAVRASSGKGKPAKAAKSQQNGRDGAAPHPKKQPKSRSAGNKTKGQARIHVAARRK